MQDHESTQAPRPTDASRRSIPAGIVAGLSAVVLLVGGGTALWTWRSFTTQSSAPPSETAPTTTQPSNPDLSQATEQTVQIYWLKSAGNQFELVPTSVRLTATNQPKEILKAAFDKMLAGSTEPEFTSTIPAGTTLKNIEVKEDGVHVDLSQAFTTGGGSTSMMGRLGQVIYTATTLDPAASVWLSVEGKPLEVLGGEGLMIDQPMTRENFEQNFDL